MIGTKLKLMAWLATVTVSVAVSGVAPLHAQEENYDSEEAEVMTRGPVHEAFASTVSFNPEPGLIVNVQPPEMIEEIPPDQQLEGDNVAWIPGYWGWDEEQDDFLWISGIWRNLPPEREWVPGYWSEIDDGHQWTAGFWKDLSVEEVSYLPEPPASIEAGPSVEATSNDQSWIPGVWNWRNDRYAWRSGYWAESRPNWLWVPSSYQWTRRGYVYNDGYWDHSVVNRGVLFAPVHFRRGVYTRPGYFYTPRTVINVSVFVNHLFLRPSYRHYYFGDYYAPRYRNNGFFASFSYNTNRRGGYDPIYAHYRWINRDDRNWERGRREYFEHRRDNEDARPPRNWARMNERSRDGRDGDFQTAQRYDQYVSNRGGSEKRFRAVDQKDRERFVAQRQEVRNFGKERQRIESGKNNESQRNVKFGRSPLVSKATEGDSKPPQRLEERASKRNGNNNGKNDDSAAGMGGRENGQGRNPGNKTQEDRDRNAGDRDQPRNDNGAGNGNRNGDRNEKGDGNGSGNGNKKANDTEKGNGDRIEKDNGNGAGNGNRNADRNQKGNGNGAGNGDANRNDANRNGGRETGGKVTPDRPMNREQDKSERNKPGKEPENANKNGNISRPDPVKEPGKRNGDQRDQPKSQQAKEQRSQPKPQQAREPQRDQPKPQQAREPQRDQPKPQQAREPQRDQPKPQQAREPQRQQPKPQQAREPQRQQPKPQQAREPQRQQPKPQQAREPQRQQPKPQQAREPQRAQPQPQRVQPQPPKATPEPAPAEPEQSGRGKKRDLRDA